MEKQHRAGGLAAALVALGMATAGCVPASQHHAALADLQRLRVEAWQRGVEAAALRAALDRATAESAFIRAYAQTPSPAVMSLAVRVEELAQKQEVMNAQLRNSPACAPSAAPPSSEASASPAPASQPGRKVTDLLYSRF